MKLKYSGKYGFYLSNGVDIAVVITRGHAISVITSHGYSVSFAHSYLNKLINA